MTRLTGSTSSPIYERCHIASSRILDGYLPPGLPSYAKSLYLKKVGGNFRNGRKRLFNAGCHGGTPDGNDFLITTLLTLIRLLNSDRRQFCLVHLCYIFRSNDLRTKIYIETMWDRCGILVHLEYAAR